MDDQRPGNGWRSTLYLSVALLEEGFLINDLRSIVASMLQQREAGVSIVKENQSFQRAKPMVLSTRLVWE